MEEVQNERDINKGLGLKKSEKTPRRRPVYPMGAERELRRAATAWVTTVIRESASFVRETMREYEEVEKYRTDDAGDFITHLRGRKRAAADKLSRKTGAMAKLEREVRVSGILAENHSVQDFNDQVYEVFGKSLNQEFFKEDMKTMVDTWIHENVSKIGGMSDEYLNKVEEIIRWGYETRQPKVNVYRRLEKLVGLTKSKARQIARDQLGTLTSQMTKHEHEAAGISKYKWITRRDDRVRPCHRLLHGRIFSWNDPPEMWYSTKSRGIVFTGKRCHPGEDVCCRCTASPVFDLEGAVRLLRIHFRGEE